jgi:hypothetical protein
MGRVAPRQDTPWWRAVYIVARACAVWMHRSVHVWRMRIREITGSRARFMLHRTVPRPARRCYHAAQRHGRPMAPKETANGCPQLMCR